jgi:hypothetical protein
LIDLLREHDLRSDFLGVFQEQVALLHPVYRLGLAWVYLRTGSVSARAEPNSSEARAMVEKGRDILRQLKERTGLNANQRQLLQQGLDSIEADLRKMQ